MSLYILISLYIPLKGPYISLYFFKSVLIYPYISLYLYIYIYIYISIDPLPRRPNHILADSSFPVSWLFDTFCVKKVVLALLGALLDRLGHSWERLIAKEIQVFQIRDPSLPFFFKKLFSERFWTVWAALGGSWGALGRSQIEQKIDPESDP